MKNVEKRERVNMWMDIFREATDTVLWRGHTASLAVLLEDIPHVCLLNTGKAIHTRWGRIDLTLVLSVLAAGATLTSDHFGTLTNLPMVLPVMPSPSPHWNIRREN